MEGNLLFKIDWAGLYWQGNLPFLLCFTLYSRANSKYKYSEGRFNGGFFALQFWGAYIWRSLYVEGLIFGILRYVNFSLSEFWVYNVTVRSETRRL